MKRFEQRNVEGSEKANLTRILKIKDNPEISEVTSGERAPFHFFYTSLDKGFQKDLEGVLGGNFKEPNAFIYTERLFLEALKYLKKNFSSPQELPCFSGEFSINIFLAGPDEFCTLGYGKKRKFPPFASGRTAGTFFIYTQGPLFRKSREFSGRKIPEERILGNSHELLHIFLKYNDASMWKNGWYALPLLLSEGLNVIAGKQLNREFNESFISAEDLLLNKGIRPLDYDQRWIPQNRFYQSAGQFMNYILKTISKKEGRSYRKSFQKVFSTIGSPEGFKNEGDFNAKRYFKNIFGIEIFEEYGKFLEQNKNNIL